MEPRRPDASVGAGARPGPLAGAFALAALSGALHVFALPPIDQGWLAFVALVPFLASLRIDSRARVQIALGGVFGLSSVVGTIHWLPGALVFGNGLGSVAAWAVSGAVAAWYVAWFAAFPVLTRWLGRGALPGPLHASLAWVAVETLRDRLMPALAWTMYGHSQHDVLPVLQLAELAGVPGISFLLVTVNALWVEACWPRSDLVGGRRRVVRLALAVTVVVVTVAAGWTRLSVWDDARDPADAASFSVAAVQLAVPQRERWQPEAAWPRVDALLDLTALAADRQARLVVWPETSIELHLDQAKDLAGRVTERLGPHPETRLLAGVPREVVGDSGTRFYNSAVLVDGRGAHVGLYDKVELYPISEYVPGWLRFIPGSERAFASQLRWAPYSRGAASQPLLDTGVPTGVLICAEGVGPRAARQRVLDGARLLVHIANDAVLPGPAAALQHFATVRFRAVETRRPLIRASNLGVNAVVSASGRVLDRSEPGAPGLAAAAVTPGAGQTVYTRAGWIWPWLCVAATALGGIPPSAWRAQGRRND